MISKVYNSNFNDLQKFLLDPSKKLENISVDKTKLAAFELCTGTLGAISLIGIAKFPVLLSCITVPVVTLPCFAAALIAHDMRVSLQNMEEICRSSADVKADVAKSPESLVHAMLKGTLITERFCSQMFINAFYDVVETEPTVRAS